ncbi:MAG: hypothetical protein JW808_01775 [Victivallales bacterium]|nr:hypothetical protein [Victivallales bacterium]
MKNSVSMSWESDFCRKTFAAAGLADSSSFWNLKEEDIDCECRLVRDICSLGARHRYSTMYIKLNKSKYRLKRASGKYFGKLMDELRVLKHLPDLHITPLIVAAQAVDEEAHQCMVLFKYPPGFIILKNLLEYNMPPPILADFDVRRRGIMENIARSVRKMRYCDYFFPHWISENIAVKNKSKEFALVDLEDFRHIRNCPVYYRLTPVSWIVRKIEWRILRKSLASGVFTRKYMKRLLQEA